MATMSLNAVLMRFFKLPPAVRMLLAVAGFGSLASIVFWLMPSLRTPRGRIWVLIIGGIGLVIFLIFWGLRRAFFRKRSSQLSGALESQGPTRGDIAEQEQIYREKFRAKLAELKANGLSVYKLPWFVLMGEPGCGKTASLIHSGLDFPLGKDEVPGFGGTRNYNWWFTNEAVILDTAGRIAFHEEGTTDKVEWEYFLKLLRTHRQRCPVNGVIIALPADKLLRDNAEERAQKASILRERLRQVHQTLGVRFPTFVLVTKMDLVGGFSEFFEEIRVDLKQRNQMCGWSRPGEFQEPYDPATFPEAFDQVYYRLRDWGMRYLQRKATEQELGMIVTFPESFRQLREPLGDYIGTIFQKSPLLEPPFFRGFYFTSAVQEGAPILDVFSRSKAGIRVAERPIKAVDSKAFFIHDFYAGKVFPEHGLVFRSARHVSLNRRMRRLVWVGSAAMIALMILMFIFGASGVNGLIKSPREVCGVASAAIKAGNATYAELPGHLRTAKQLREHFERYNRRWARVQARLLFIGADIQVPQEYVGAIHARFVLECIVKPVLAEVESELGAVRAGAAPTPARYLEALRVYTKWYGEVVGQYQLDALDAAEPVQRRAEFLALLTFLGLPDADRQDAADQFEAALQTLAAESRSFAREILRDAVAFDGQRATGTIVAAIDQITESWKPLTQISADNANPMVKYWADFASRLADLQERYGQILALSQEFAAADQYAAAVERFNKLTQGVQYLGDPEFSVTEPGSLHEAFYNLMSFLRNTPVPEDAQHRIIRLRGLLDEFRAQWDREFDTLRQALESGAPDRQAEPQRRVYAALDRGQTDLVTAFQLSADQIRARLGLPKDAEPLDYYVGQNLIETREASPPAAFDGRAEVLVAREALGPSDRLRGYLLELRELVGGQEQELKDLDNLENWPRLLQRLGASEPAGKLLAAWFADTQRAEREVTPDLIRVRSGLKDHPFWRPVELFELTTRMWSACQSNRTDRLLTQMAEKAAATLKTDRLPGLARLMPGFDAPAPLPFTRHRFNVKQPAPVAQAPPQAEEEQEAAEGEELRRFRRREEPRREEAAERLEREETTALLYNYHTRELLQRTLREYERVRAVLGQYAGREKVTAPLAQAADAYVDGYFSDWYAVYRDPPRLLDEGMLAFMERCRDGGLSWPEYVTALGQEENNFGRLLADRLAAVVREVVMFDVGLGSDATDNAVFKRIETRLKELNRQRRSVPNLERAMRDPRNAPGDSEGDPEVVYARQLESAWREYVRAVRALGPLTDDQTRSSNQPPDLQKLTEGLIYRQATTPESPLIAPLVDIAGYGQQLLVNHLEEKLARLFVEARGRYPVVDEAAARDDSALLTRIGAQPTLEPRAFIELLRQVAEFQRHYGKLYRDVRPDSPALTTLDACEAWIRFLYDPPDALLRGDPPPLDVGVAIVRDPSGTVGNAGNVYSKVTVRLPLLSSYGTAGKALEVATRAGEGIQAGTIQQVIGNQPATYRWSLLPAAGVSFDRMTVVVAEKHPDARAEYPERAVGWDLPGHPWSLLMALSARRDNDLGDGFWKIPVRMETGVDPIGFLIGVRIGSRERPFPGVIPPLPDLGPRPRMTRADFYLTSPP